MLIIQGELCFRKFAVGLTRVSLFSIIASPSTSTWKNLERLPTQEKSVQGYPVQGFPALRVPIYN